MAREGMLPALHTTTARAFARPLRFMQAQMPVRCTA